MIHNGISVLRVVEVEHYHPTVLRVVSLRKYVSAIHMAISESIEWAHGPGQVSRDVY
jgi:hypothetical protein